MQQSAIVRNREGCRKVETESNIRVLMITSEWPTADLPNSGSFILQQVEFLRRAGVQVDVFPFRGAGNPLNYLRAWVRVQNRLSRNNYNLVHAQWGQSALLAIPKRKPLVITFRGSDLEGVVGKSGQYTPWGWMLRVISKSMSRLADQVIVVSERIARHLPQRPYYVIPSGLDLDLFRPIPKSEARQMLGLPRDKRLVLFAAAPENLLKRYDLARVAVEKLNAQLAADLVVAHGVARSKMPAFMSACDALLLTSMHEGSPNVVKEALACNLPVVSVSVGDVPDRIGSVDGCFLCTDDRPETIAAGLVRVLSREKRIDARSAVSDLDENVIAAKVISVYQAAISHIDQLCLKSRPECLLATKKHQKHK